MSAMDRDALVERVAETLFAVDARGFFYWKNRTEAEGAKYLERARAVLSVIEPAVREDTAGLLDAEGMYIVAGAIRSASHGG